MAIVCGTDFSPRAEAAVVVSAALADRLGEQLHLVHVADPSLRSLPPEERAMLEATAVRRLTALGESVRRKTNQGVVTVVCVGAADEELTRYAARHSASLIVVSSMGHRLEPLYRLGGTSERLAMHGSVPVLVLREADPFLRWAQNEQKLKVVIGVSDSQAADHALAFARVLARAGGLELILGQVYFGEELERRYGLKPGGVADSTSAVSFAMEHDLLKRLGPVSGTPVRAHILRGVGRLGDHLLEIAEAERADLVVVGSHQPRGFGRMFSPSAVVAHHSRMAVAVVPASAAASQQAERQLPTVDRILVATDLGPTAKDTLTWAYALLTDRRGEVHVLHVLQTPPHSDEPYQYALPELNATKPDKGEADAQLLSYMRSLAPSSAKGEKLTTHFHLARSPDVAKHIVEKAERLAVDLIVVGTHVRSAVSRMTMGSFAEEVLQRSRRPVFIVPERPE